MDFKHKIIQWNCRGLKPNFNEVSLLISEYNPSVFCFQETFLKPDDNISLKGFNIYNYVHTDCLRPSGGASVFVKSSFPQRKIDLQTELQATAVSVTFDKEITTCSVYIPPSFFLNSQHLDSLLQQLPYLLQGEEHPQCVGCDAPFTVRHFLLECGDFAQVRNNCFHVNNMKELFQDIHIDSIMTFLRQINLFNKI